MASSSNIPLVDLSLSQEEEIEIHGRKRKEDIIHILEDNPNRKKPRNNSLPSQNGVESMLQRLETLENILTCTPSRHEEHKYVTREEFQDLVKELQEIKQKVLGMEKVFMAIKSAFLPTASSNSTRTNSTVVRNTSDPDESNVTASTPAQQNEGNIVIAPSPLNQKQGSSSACGETSTPRASIPGTVPRRISATSNSPSVQKVIPPLPRKSQTLRQEPSTTTVHSPSRITITPVNNPKPQTPINSRSTPSQLSNINPPRKSSANITISASVMRSNYQILNKSAEHDTSARTASNCNINDLADDVLQNVRIKQEVLEQPHERVLEDHTRSFRKDEDDRILVYIDGGGNKCRNQEKYVAYAGHSLHENWVKVKIYESDLNLASLKKDISTLKKQAEIIAAYLAIEDLKRHSAQRPLKIRVVTKNNRLVSTMTNLQKVYYYSEDCTCEVPNCPHPRRWETMDSFATAFTMNQDLPRLACAVRSQDVLWRTYSAAELENKELWETFKRKFKELKNYK